ncbi:MAG: hypothetical protein M1833_000400 [Piccolia ochrophora]|nr:MAG: hypothetical protein M1833_000400 [Piccolia ochrophora]
MSEDQDLLMKISQVSGHINRHKNQQATTTSSRHSAATHTPLRPGRGTRRSRPGTTSTSSYRNRSLILNNTTSGVQTPVTSADGDASSGLVEPGNGTDDLASNGGWIVKHDRHRQLINSSVYEKELNTRARDMEETRKLVARRRDDREKMKLSKYLHRHALNAGGATASLGSTPAVVSRNHLIRIDDLSFHVVDGGSRLVKVSDDATPTKPTPKRANVGGVTFVRSKNGNLYRLGLVQAKRAGQIRKAANTGTQDLEIQASEDSDLSSEARDYDEFESDDIDSDENEDGLALKIDPLGTPDIARQSDFVRL